MYCDAEEILVLAMERLMLRHAASAPEERHIMPEHDETSRIADMAERTQRTQRKLEAVKFYLQCQNMAATARQFGITTKTLTLWVDRYNSEGLLGLEDRSRAPRRDH